jgi:hypothetical protein
MNKTCVENLNINNENWKLYSISNDDSLRYFQTSNKNNINENDLHLPHATINNCDYINLSNKIIYSILNDEKIQFLNIYDNLFYDVYNIVFYYKDAPIIFYYCNKDDPYVLIQTSSYMDFVYIFYINKKEGFTISNSTSGFQYYLNEIKYVLTNFNMILHTEIKFNKFLFFGFNNNIGHYLWNEISGLFYFLNNKEYHNKIDGIVIGQYDFFNIESYLKNNYNFNIIKFNELFNSNACYNSIINLNNIFPVFLNSFYIDKEVRHIIDFNMNDHEIYEEQKNILEISIDIRTNRRYLMNQVFFYTKIIKNIVHDYENYTIKINFLGCFETKNYIINDKNEEYIEQNEIVNNIINHFKKDKNIYFKNFIGKNILYTKNNVINSKLFIHSFGTSVSNLLNWIYNIKTICFGPFEAYDWTTIQYTVLQNYNTIIIPKEYILTNNGLNLLNDNKHCNPEFIKQ